MQTIGERLQILVKQLNTTAARLALDVGVSKSSFSKNKVGSSPNSETIAKIIDKYRNINPMWLLLGEGDMMIIKEYNAIVSNHLIEDPEPVIIELQKKYIAVLEENKKLNEEIMKLKKEI